MRAPAMLRGEPGGEGHHAHDALSVWCSSTATAEPLARARGRPIAYTWTARHSQTYPELASLEHECLIRHRVVGRRPAGTRGLPLG
jgi:hypothetical protein